MKAEIHIGQLIKQEMVRQGRKPSWLAKELNYTRYNVYKIFARRYIDTETLLHISQLLGVDFFAVYTNYLHLNLPSLKNV
ncbi:MAG: XRE family transcriptional regulator [Paludibacteraceae bacterium]|nr:XRE family transcriptional regulator [Paludibacteraceae bacterium]